MYKTSLKETLEFSEGLHALETVEALEMVELRGSQHIGARRKLQDCESRLASVPILFSPAHIER